MSTVVFCHVTDQFSHGPMEVWGIRGWDGTRKTGGPIINFKIDAKAAHELADRPEVTLHLDSWLPYWAVGEFKASRATRHACNLLIDAPNAVLTGTVRARDPRKARTRLMAKQRRSATV